MTLSNTLIKMNEHKKQHTRTNVVESFNPNINIKIPTFKIQKDDMQEIEEMIHYMDVMGKSRDEILIGMYGKIKNPKTGKRFVIPNLYWDMDNYILEYSKIMKILVDKPETFSKIMMWE